MMLQAQRLSKRRTWVFVVALALAIGVSTSVLVIAVRPRSSQTLLAHIDSATPGICLSDLSNAPTANDTFSLRAASNGPTQGNLLQVASSVGLREGGCGLSVTFLISAADQFFDVVDETNGDEWGPFSYERVMKNGEGTVSLTVSCELVICRSVVSQK